MLFTTTTISKFLKSTKTNLKYISTDNLSKNESKVEEEARTSFEEKTQEDESQKQVNSFKRGEFIIYFAFI